MSYHNRIRRYGQGSTRTVPALLSPEDVAAIFEANFDKVDQVGDGLWPSRSQHDGHKAPDDR